MISNWRTLILTSPAGRTHVTTPGSALLFPSLRRAVGGMPAPEADPTPNYCAQRTAMMPKRRRTRAQNRAQRIATERRHNHQARHPAKTGRPAWARSAQSDSLSCQPMRFGLVRVAEWQTR